MPALYNLSRTKVLPEEFALIGVDVAQATAESWRDHLYGTLKSFVGNATAEFDLDRIDEAAWQRLAEKMSYVQGDLNDSGLYGKLGKHLEEAEYKHGTKGNVIFYLAVADRFFGPVVDKLGESKLVEIPEHGDKPEFWRRVVIEKPFGHSLDSARALNARILRTLQEHQIFRIDHFLGKDTVQNIMALRFANGMFEPIWNRDRIDHVQITAAETVGVEQRGKFYEVTGALRPGPVVELAAVQMAFHYQDWFPKEPNAGYETLLYDVMIGDPTLYAWRVVQPVLDAWAAEEADFPNYDSGSDGPKAAEDLVARDADRSWRPVALPVDRRR